MVPPTVMLVITARQAELSVKVTVKGASTVAPAAAVSVGPGGVSTLNVLDVAGVRPGLVNVHVALADAEVLV